MIWQRLAFAASIAMTTLPASAEMAATTQLGWLRNGEYAAILAADAKGFFKDEGIVHRIQDGGPGKNPIPIVAVGQAQFGIATSGMQVIAARTARDPVDIVAIATLYQQSPSIYMSLGAPDAPAPKPKDMEGKRVGVQSDSEFLFRAFARKNGIDTSKVELVFVKATAEPLLVGQIDFFSGWIMNQTYQVEQEAAKPDAAPPLKGKTWKAMRFSEYGIPTYSDVIFATAATLRDNPELVRHYLRAVARGMQFVIDHPDEAVDLVARTPGQIEDARKLAWRFRLQSPLFVSAATEVHGLLWMDPATWTQMVTFLREGEQISRAIPASEAMDDGFLPGLLPKTGEKD